jgi:DNA (cytosine-5)-methyltransferase 1
MEAASVAWHPLGWQPVGFSEIEPFPCAILKHRFPHTPNYGSLTEYKQWPLEPGAIDLLVGGCPCQSFSVAGLRRGMEDPRGNLTLVFLGLADKLKPRWVVFENVPGLLSSAGGRDFGSFLGALVELGYGFAYRVLDAQHFGVPQRRRRVFVVACLGDWRAPAEVLLEPDCVRRDTKKGRAKGQSAAAGAKGGSGADGMQTPNCVISGTLRANPGSGWRSNGTPVEPVVVTQVPSACYPLKDPNDIACAEHRRQNGIGNDGDPAFTLRTAVTPGVATPMAVRRLTPVECERLQGFPDNWSRISWKGKPETECPDGPRYKACGNSMAVPCMFWIGQRIAAADAKHFPHA